MNSIKSNTSIKSNAFAKIKKFFEPFRQHPILVLLGILGIALLSCLNIAIGLTELVRQNSYPIQMLAAEQIMELGPDYVDESKRYAELIDQYYTEHLEQRDYAAIMRFLCPEYSPKKALASALSDLEKAAKNGKEEEAKKVIQQAGLASHNLYKLSKRFPRSPYKWFKSENLPDWLLTDLDNAFDEFHKQVNNLENAQTQETAERECRKACRNSRRTLLLLSLAQLGYENEEKKIERFLRDVDRARYLALLFAERYKSKQKLFSDRARNMNLRANVAEAMLANDMDRASELLREVIEIAFEKEKGNAVG